MNLQYWRKKKKEVKSRFIIVKIKIHLEVSAGFQQSKKFIDLWKDLIFEVWGATTWEESFWSNSSDLASQKRKSYFWKEEKNDVMSLKVFDCEINADWERQPPSSEGCYMAGSQRLADVQRTCRTHLLQTLTYDVASSQRSWQPPSLLLADQIWTSLLTGNKCSSGPGWAISEPALQPEWIIEVKFTSH